MSWSIFIVGFFFYYGNKKKRFSTTFSLLFFSGVEHAAAPGVADARFVPGVCLLDDDVVVRAGRVEMQPELLLRDVPVVDQRRLFVDVDAAARQLSYALLPSTVSYLPAAWPGGRAVGHLRSAPPPGKSLGHPMIDAGWPVAVGRSRDRPSGLEVVGLTAGDEVGVEVEVGSGPNQARTT